MPADFMIGPTISDDLPKNRLPKDRLLKSMVVYRTAAEEMQRHNLQITIRPGHVDNPGDRVKFRRLSS